jgi:hypothetical protein
MPVEKSNLSKGYELVVYLSNKVKNGSVKVSEKDLSKLKVGIVEDVIISSVENSETIQIMLFSDSKIKPGNIIMSVSDAQAINAEEGSKVTVKKAGDVMEKEKIPVKSKTPKTANIPAKGTKLDKNIEIKKN